MCCNNRFMLKKISNLFKLNTVVKAGGQKQSALIYE